MVDEAQDQSEAIDTTGETDTNEDEAAPNEEQTAPVKVAGITFAQALTDSMDDILNAVNTLNRVEGEAMQAQETHDAAVNSVTKAQERITTSDVNIATAKKTGDSAINAHINLMRTFQENRFR